MKMTSKNKYIVAITLASLMMLPSFQQIYLGNKFESNRPVIYTENKNTPIKIVNQTIDANILNTTVLYPDGTKKTTLSISAGQVVDGHPMVRVNFTYYTHPENQQANPSPTLSKSQQEEPQTILRPVPPPDVGPPPVPYYLWDTSVYFLYQGLNKPTNGSPPFNVKYTQPDNYFSYWPRDWWTPWAFMVTKITEHLNKTVLEDVVAGHEDLQQLLTTQFGYAGVAIGLTGFGISAVALFLGAKLTAAGIAMGWVPYVGLALIAIGIIVTAVSLYLANQQYDAKRWVENTVMTDQGDGFTYIDIRNGSDEVWYLNPYFSRPYTMVLHYSARSYYVSWGKDRDDFQYLSTEWWAYADEFPKGHWPDATLRPEDYDFMYK
jgi:uncharacterized membrane protein (DUF485 family)